MARFVFCSTIVACCFPTLLYACGGGYERTPILLSQYMQFLPGKTFIATNRISVHSSAPPRPDEIIAVFSKGPSPDLVGQVDAFISRARLAECAPPENQPASGSQGTADSNTSNQFDHSTLNALENLRDVAASRAGNANELKAYAQWRFQSRDVKNSDLLPAYLAEVEKRREMASPGMQPAWLYEEGAMLFLNGKVDGAITKFDSVLNDPGATAFKEMALFMKARCYRTQVYIVQDPYSPTLPNQAVVNAKTQQTLDTFHLYLKLYPQGRFASDCYGWLGGLEGDDVQALCDFAKEAEYADHPETVCSASGEMDRIFDNISDSSLPKDYDKIAEHPELALSMCYLIVGFPHDTDDSTLNQTIVDRKQWRTGALDKLASAVLLHRDLYKGREGETKYLAILAHAASDDGDQTKALELVEMALKHPPLTDDLYFIKSLALQRSNRLVAAVACYRDLIRKYPESLLAADAKYRLALALHDEGKNGDALQLLASQSQNLLPLDYPSENVTTPTPAYWIRKPVYSGEQMSETVNSLVNYSPVETLLPALEGTDPAFQDFRTQLKEIVVARYLAQDDFANAAKWIPDPAEKAELSKHAKDSKTVISANPADTAAAKIADGLAQYWADHQGKLTRIDFMSGVNPLVGLDAALTLHFTRESVQDQQKKVDELTHACRWWQRAEELDPKGSETPNALWKILQSQRVMDERDPYGPNHADEASLRGIYDKLKTGFPDSVEAKKYAILWTFPATKPTTWSFLHGFA